MARSLAHRDYYRSAAGRKCPDRAGNVNKDGDSRETPTRAALPADLQPLTISPTDVFIALSRTNTPDDQDQSAGPDGATAGLAEGLADGPLVTRNAEHRPHGGT
ncbi:hypothetical protein AAFF_G00156210 [Aldrovandia affinis]|uniref:Uncharacterized protein n=1 Tax=Aldrovandia affinis TaxID=143900 RepID=A0AAD7RNW4_9TELE|nr:hypothetical protein AAFF_G00156210 [Aldrovandia affinis]